MIPLIKASLNGGILHDTVKASLNRGILHDTVMASLNRRTLHDTVKALPNRGILHDRVKASLTITQLRPLLSPTAALTCGGNLLPVLSDVITKRSVWRDQRSVWRDQRSRLCWECATVHLYDVHDATSKIKAHLHAKITTRYCRC